MMMKHRTIVMIDYIFIQQPNTIYNINYSGMNHINESFQYNQYQYKAKSNCERIG